MIKFKLQKIFFSWITNANYIVKYALTFCKR